MEKQITFINARLIDPKEEIERLRKQDQASIVKTPEKKKKR